MDVVVLDIIVNVSIHLKCYMLSGLTPVLEGLLLSSLNADLEGREFDLLFAPARVNGNNKPQQVGLNHD